MLIMKTKIVRKKHIYTNTRKNMTYLVCKPFSHGLSESKATPKQGKIIKNTY